MFMLMRPSPAIRSKELSLQWRDLLIVFKKLPRYCPFVRYPFVFRNMDL